MANSLDPDQARHFVGPDLGPNCLQRQKLSRAVADKEWKILKINVGIMNKQNVGGAEILLV